MTYRAIVEMVFESKVTALDWIAAAEAEGGRRDGELESSAVELETPGVSELEARFEADREARARSRLHRRRMAAQLSLTLRIVTKELEVPRVSERVEANTDIPEPDGEPFMSYTPCEDARPRGRHQTEGFS